MTPASPNGSVGMSIDNGRGPAETGTGGGNVVPFGDLRPMEVEDLPRLVHKGERVVTTEHLAAIYGAPPKRIHDNHQNNAERFEVGRHLFRLSGDDLAALKNNPDFVGVVGQRARHLILWTAAGALRHCKLLDTEQAWEKFEAMEASYFREVAAKAGPSPTLAERRVQVHELNAATKALDRIGKVGGPRAMLANIQRIYAKVGLRIDLGTAQVQGEMELPPGDGPSAA